MLVGKILLREVGAGVLMVWFVGSPGACPFCSERKIPVTHALYVQTDIPLQTPSGAMGVVGIALPQVPVCTLLTHFQFCNLQILSYVPLIPPRLFCFPSLSVSCSPFLFSRADWASALKGKRREEVQFHLNLMNIGI